MARAVKFNFGGNILESEIIKVDRTKLYGSSKKIVKDPKGNVCITSDLYEGSKILPKGSISQVLIDDKGSFVKRSELVGFNLNNQKVEKVPSIFTLENICEKVVQDADTTGLETGSYLNILTNFKEEHSGCNASDNPDECKGKCKDNTYSAETGQTSENTCRDCPSGKFSIKPSHSGCNTIPTPWWVWVLQ